MLYINPNNKNHQSLQEDVESFLESNGFKTADAPYHETYPPAITDILWRRWTLTDLYLRCRADCIAIHTKHSLTFEFECKTHANPRYGDLTVELLPIIHHLDKAKRGVKCLYCYRNPFEGEDYGFWIEPESFPKPRAVYIPNRRCWDEHRQNIMDWAKEYFGGVSIRDPNKVGGTGDPYIVVDKSNLRKMSSWKELITRELASFSVLNEGKGMRVNTPALTSEPH